MSDSEAVASVGTRGNEVELQVKDGRVLLSPSTARDLASRLIVSAAVAEGSVETPFTLNKSQLGVGKLEG